MERGPPPLINPVPKNSQAQTAPSAEGQVTGSVGIVARTWSFLSLGAWERRDIRWNGVKWLSTQA
jgi:hypothetical protein